LPNSNEKIEQSSMIEVKNPSGQIIQFEPDKHVYTLKGSNKTIRGVTGFYSQFFPVFETDKVAEKCAGKGKYAGMDVEQIKIAWKEESDRGKTEGTNVHAYAEHKFNPTIPKPEPLSERCERLFVSVDNTVEKLNRWFEFIAAELIVFSVLLDIAGTIDLVMRDKENQDIIILDWKQNKEIKTDNPWQKALPPIAHLDDCDIVKYNIQLAIYEKILKYEQYYDAPNHRLGLIHLLPNGQAINIRLNNMDREVDVMFEHAKKKQISLFDERK
jgi:PD-(D/E)XK nuclease superfamily protein